MLPGFSWNVGGFMPNPARLFLKILKRSFCANNGHCFELRCFIVISVFLYGGCYNFFATVFQTLSLLLNTMVDVFGRNSQPATPVEASEIADLIDFL